LKPAHTVPEFQVLVARLVRRALEDTGVSMAHVANKVHRASNVVERWLSETDEHRHVPLWLLAHREAVGDALFERIVSDLRAERVRQGAPSVVPLERVLGTALRVMADALARGMTALEDGKLTREERTDLRPVVAKVRAWCDRFLRDDESALRVVEGGQ